MIINLNPKWRIRSEPANWVVDHMPDAKDPVKGRKSDRWRPQGFFGTLSGAVVFCARRQIEVMEGEYHAEALEPLCRALDRIEAECRQALAKS